MKGWDYTGTANFVMDWQQKLWQCLLWKSLNFFSALDQIVTGIGRVGRGQIVLLEIMLTTRTKFSLCRKLR